MLITVWSVVFPLQPVYQRFGRRMPNDTFRSYVGSETQLIKTSGEFTITLNSVLTDLNMRSGVVFKTTNFKQFSSPT